MIKTTTRLKLSKFTLEDADFIVQILNDPGFLKNIGDRKVRNAEEAKTYLQTVIFPGYDKHGFSMFRLALKDTDQVVGMCGLLKRDNLEHVDVGYALLQEHCGNGYASEAVEASLAMAKEDFAIQELVAVIAPDNLPSIRLIEKAGFDYQRMVKLRADDIELKLFYKKLY